MKKGVAMLLGLLIICAMSEAQNLKNENKIDPAFRQLINNEKVKSTFGNKSSSKTKSKTSISKEKVSEKQPKRVMYECTVYTKDAKALKDKGIIINSALPTFVTATVSLDQIELMSAMNVVTYIEAAKTIYPTQRNVNATPSKH